MRIIKFIVAILLIQTIVSCGSKSLPERTLAGKWKITGAVGNDGRHWTGSFTLEENGSDYTGLFLWDAVDGKSSGTDNITGKYNATTQVLTMKSVVISGNIESVFYTANVTDGSTKMHGTWTGSSDGSVENPGSWSAVKQ